MTILIGHWPGLAIAIAALLLRLWHLGTQPLWFDEAMTLHIALQPNGLEFAHNTPPLYYLALRPWVAVFGADAVGFRSLSAVAGAGFVWVCYLAGREALGARIGAAIAAFVAIAPIHVYYSQEARAYSLLLFELAIALWMLRRVAANGSRGASVAFVVAGTAALYTHFLAAIPLAVACLVHGVVAPRGARRRVVVTCLVTTVVIAMAVAPWLWSWSRQTAFEPRDMQWLAVVWSRLAGASAFTMSADLLLLGGQNDNSPIFLKQFSTMSFPGAARLAGHAAAAILAVLLLARLQTLGPVVRKAALRSVAMTAVPLVILWSLSFAHPTYCPGRYDLIAFPGLAALVGIAVGALTVARERWLRRLAVAATGVFASVLVAKDVRYFAEPAIADASHDVSALLATGVGPGEVVVLCGAEGAPVLAHLLLEGFTWSGHHCRSTRGGPSFECRLLPMSLESAPGSMSRYLRTLADSSLPDELARLVRGNPAPGVWLVLGRELYANGGDGALNDVRHRLFEVLSDAGYTAVDGNLALGVAHLRHAPR